MEVTGGADDGFFHCEESREWMRERRVIFGRYAEQMLVGFSIRFL